MKKRVLCGMISLIMLLSLMPAQAFGFLQGEENAQTASELTLPLLTEGESATHEVADIRSEMPCLNAEPYNPDYFYTHEGVGKIDVYDLRFSSDIPPTENGQLHILDSNGNVAATSDTAFYYLLQEDEQLYSVSATIWNTSSLPAGVYSIRLVAGNDESYVCDRFLRIVEKGSLLLHGAHVSSLRTGEDEFVVSLTISGLEQEAQMNGFSMHLLDESGASVASSTGEYRYRDIDCDGKWSCIAQMRMETGCALEKDAEYRLQLLFDESSHWVDGAGAVGEYPYSPDDAKAEIESVNVSDAQTGRLIAKLKNWNEGETYRLVATGSHVYDQNKSPAYGQWLGEVPTDGMIELPLTLNGITVPMSEYPSEINISLYAYDENSLIYSELLSETYFENLYNINFINGEKQIWFEPYYIKPTATKIPFSVDVHGVNLRKYGVGDVLTLCDEAGKVLGRCDTLRFETNDNTSGSIYGTLQITGALLPEHLYDIRLNDVEICKICSVSNLYCRRFRIEPSDYFSGDRACFTNLGKMTVKADTINSSGCGYFAFRSGNKTVLSSSVIVGTVSEYFDHLLYAYTFTEEQVCSALTDKEAYELYFVDNSGAEIQITGTEMLSFDADKVPFDPANENHAYFRWNALSAGDQQIEVSVYPFYHDSFRNVSQEEIETALREIILFDGDRTITVERITWDEENDKNFLTAYLHLSEELPAGEMSAQYGSIVLNPQFTVEPVASEQETMLIGNVDINDCTVYGQGLPTDWVYTAKIYRGYTCVKESFPLTLCGENTENKQCLYFDKTILTDVPVGKYIIRVCGNGRVLRELDFIRPDDLQACLIAYDSGREYSSDYGPANALITSGRVSFFINGGNYRWIRCSENREELNTTAYNALINCVPFELSEGEGGKTLYVQLKDLSGTQSNIIPLTVWRAGDDGKIAIYVHDSVEGICNDDIVHLTVGSDCPQTNAYVELVKGDGTTITRQMAYEGYGVLPQLHKEAVFESPHYFDEDMAGTWNYKVTGASKIRVTFSEQTFVTKDYNYIYVYSGSTVDDDYLVGAYTGRELAGITLDVPSDTVTVVQTGWWDRSMYGFSVTEVVDADVEEKQEDCHYLFGITLDGREYDYGFGGYLNETEKVRFYLGAGSYTAPTSDAVERMLHLGALDHIILPQFNYGDVAIRSTEYVLYGYATPDADVHITLDGEGLCMAKANENGYFTVRLTGLAEGSHSLHVYDSAGISAQDNNQLEVDRTPPVIRDVGFAFHVGGASAVLRWGCSDSDIAAFTIYRNSTRLGTVRCNGEGNTYAYSVSATGNDGNTFTIQAADKAGNTSSITVSTADITPPTAPPAAPSVTGRTLTTLTISWPDGSDDRGIAGYDIYNGTVKLAETTTAAPRCTLTNLAQGTAYTLHVKTRDFSGLLSEASPVLHVSTAALKIDNDNLSDSYIVESYPGKKIPLCCTLTSDEASYQPQITNAQLQYRLKGETSWETHDLYSKGTTISGNWNIDGKNGKEFIPLGTYELRFHITVAEEKQTYFGPAHSVVLKYDDEAPTVPGIPIADSHSTTAITFHWKGSTDNIAVDHYEVYRNGNEIAQTKETQYTDTGRTTETSYAYIVKAVDARGNVSLPSPNASLSTAALTFASVVDLPDALILEYQPNGQTAVSARFQPEDGYETVVSMTMEYKPESAHVWQSIELDASAADAYSFFGGWCVIREGGYLPAGAYLVRFAVTDGNATAYSTVQKVILQHETVLPCVDRISCPKEGGTYGGRNFTIAYAVSDNVKLGSVSAAYSTDGTAFTEIDTKACAKGLSDDGNISWDASTLPSGNYFLRLAVTDAAGNTADRTVTFTIDNTAPAPVTEFSVAGNSRYLLAMWNHAATEPAMTFRVYRADAALGEYTCVGERGVRGFYEDGTTIDADRTYYYKVTALDKYGNESAFSSVACAAMTADTQSPTIGDMRPLNEAELCKTVNLGVTASDNYRLAKAVFAYRLSGTESWTQIAECPAGENVNNTAFEYEWDITQMATGIYEIRATVYDDSIHDVEANGGAYTANPPAVTAHTVKIQHYSLPTAPRLSVQAGYKSCTLSWTYSGDQALLDRFSIYSASTADGDYSLIKSVSAATAQWVCTIPRDSSTYFKIVAADRYNTIAWSNSVVVKSVGTDTEKPVAVISPEVLRAAGGTSFWFSAFDSTDNDLIKDYYWEFGDGDTSREPAPTHIYRETGIYEVTLTVEDEAGNRNTVTRTAEVVDTSTPDAQYTLVMLRVVDASREDKRGIPNAVLHFFSAIEGAQETTAQTGKDGTASVLLRRGTHQVSVTADSYMPATKTLKVTDGVNGRMDATIGMGMTSVVSGKLTVNEMTPDEIEQAGIDTDNPDNRHVWKFETTITFHVGLKVFELPIVAGYKNEVGSYTNAGGWYILDGVGGGGSGGYRVGIFPMLSEGFYLIIYGEAHWLKEMYNVELLVTNESNVDNIENCTAELVLPEGLSLATMLGKQQMATIDMGEIPRAQEKSARWFVRGDKEGEYNLTANVAGELVNGGISEPFAITFTTKDPVKVYAGSALKLTITADDMAERGKDYHVVFRLSNVSDKPMYDLSFGITGMEQGKIMRLTSNDGEKTVRLPIEAQDFSDSYTYHVKELAPGGYIEIAVSTTIWFNSIAEVGEAAAKAALKYATGVPVFGEFIDVAYYLDDVSVVTLEESTTTVPHEVVIKHVERDSLIDKVIYGLANEIFKDDLKNFNKDLGGTFIELVGSTIEADSTFVTGAKSMLKMAQGETDYTFTISIDDGKHTENSIYNDYISITTGSDTQGIIDSLNGTKLKVGCGEVSFQAKSPGTTKIKIEAKDSLGKMKREYSWNVTVLDTNVKVSTVLTKEKAESSYQIDEETVKVALERKNQKDKNAYLTNPYMEYDSEMEFSLEGETSDTNFAATIGADSLHSILEKSVTTKLSYNGNVASVSFNRAAITKIEQMMVQSRSDNLTVMAERLSDEMAKEIGGGNPTYRLMATLDGSKVTDFGEGSVLVSLPYELEGDKPLVIEHILDDGSVNHLICSYDKESKRVLFAANGFSYFVIRETNDDILMTTPEITGKATHFGQVLTATIPDISDNELAYFWYHSGDYSTPLAEGPTYTLTPADSNTVLVVRVSKKVGGQFDPAGFTESRMTVSTLRDNLSWMLEDGILTIDGVGPMEDYMPTNPAPWQSSKDNILRIVIGNAVTSIGDYAFCDCEKMTHVDIPAAVTYIGANAFSGCGRFAEITYGGEAYRWDMIFVDEGNAPLQEVTVTTTPLFFKSLDAVMQEGELTVTARIDYLPQNAVVYISALDSRGQMLFVQQAQPIDGVAVVTGKVPAAQIVNAFVLEGNTFVPLLPSESVPVSCDLPQGNNLLLDLEDFSRVIRVAADGAISTSPVLPGEISGLPLNWTVSNSTSYEVSNGRLRVIDYTALQDETLLLTASVAGAGGSAYAPRSFKLRTSILRASNRYFETVSMDVGRSATTSYYVEAIAAKTVDFMQNVCPVYTDVTYAYSATDKNGTSIPYTNVVNVDDRGNMTVRADAPLYATVAVRADVGHEVNGAVVTDTTVCRIFRVVPGHYDMTYVYGYPAGETGGTTDAETRKRYTEGEVISDIPEPTCSNYLFVGWYVDNALQTAFWKPDDTAPTMPSTNQTIFAKWIRSEYTVLFDANGGSVDPVQKTVTYAAVYGALPKPTRTGYTFNGWYSMPEGGTKITGTTRLSTAEAHTLYAQWSIIRVEIPQFANQTYSAARKWCTDNGIKHTVAYAYAYDKSSGTCLSNTQAGTTVDYGSDIEITVSKGTKPLAIGDKVRFAGGNVHSNSYGGDAYYWPEAEYYITNTNPGAPYPYHIGSKGWVSASCVQQRTN